jgi:hypothetical protein
MVKRILPGEVYNIFFCSNYGLILSFVGSVSAYCTGWSPISYWSRFGIIQYYVQYYIVPRYSRLRRTKKIIDKMIKIQLLLVCIGIIFFGMFFAVVKLFGC